MPKTLSTPELKELALKTANKYHLNSTQFLGTLNCESRFVPSAVGDQGRSFGIAQVFLPAHPEVSKKEALDPVWAIEWAGKEWSEGRQMEWSCFRILYK